MDLFDLMPSESKLIEALRAENVCDLLSRGSQDHVISKVIRGEFLSGLIKGNMASIAVPPKGVLIRGADIIGDVDLQGCRIEYPVMLEYCKIYGVLDLSKSRISELVLKGSTVEHLNISEMNCKGSVILSYGFRTVNLVMARGVNVGGQLGCSGGEFSGYPHAISLEAAVVEESFFWRQVQGLWGTVDLTNARVGCLIDDPDSWPRRGNLRLAGFSYGSIESNTSTHYFDRLDWLERQYNPHLTYDFRPQPFEQLTKVLNESGREFEAKKIAISKHHLQRDANFMRRNRKLVELKHSLKFQTNPLMRACILISIEKEAELSFDNLILFGVASCRWLVSFLFWIIAGYGYRPTRCIGWSFAMILVGGSLFSEYQKDGNIVYLHNISSSATNFNNNNVEFHPFAYAADVFIPFVDLGQASSWSIRANPEWQSQPMLLFFWSFIFLGWIAAVIFAASVTGLIRK